MCSECSLVSRWGVEWIGVWVCIVGYVFSLLGVCMWLLSECVMRYGLGCMWCVVLCMIVKLLLVVV